MISSQSQDSLISTNRVTASCAVGLISHLGDSLMKDIMTRRKDNWQKIISDATYSHSLDNSSFLCRSEGKELCYSFRSSNGELDWGYARPLKRYSGPQMVGMEIMEDKVRWSLDRIPLLTAPLPKRPFCIAFYTPHATGTIIIAATKNLPS